MNRAHLVRAFFFLWWVLGIVLLVLSVRTVRFAVGFVLFVMVHGAISPRELWNHPTGHPA